VPSTRGGEAPGAGRRRRGPGEERAWRSAALLGGATLMLAALSGVLLLPDRPATARGGARRGRALAAVRLALRGGGAGGGAAPPSHLEALAAALRDPRARLASFVAAAVAAVAGPSHLPLTTTVQTGLGSMRAHHMAAAVYIAGIFVLNLIAWGSDSMRDRRWHIVGTLMLAFVGIVVGATSRNAAAKAAFGTLFAMGIWSTMPLALAWMGSAIAAPAEKRAVVIAIVHGVAGVASVLGSQVWPRSSAPRYHVDLANVCNYPRDGCHSNGRRACLRLPELLSWHYSGEK
jgi:hypothetical protein